MNTEEEPTGAGAVSFTYTEREFITAYRAVRIANEKSYDSAIMRLGVIVGGHVMLLAGIEVVVLWLLGTRGPNGPIPLGVGIFGAVLAIWSCYFLYIKVYGYRRHLRSLYRSFPLRDEKMTYQFTSLRFVFQHRLAQGSTDWNLVAKVTQLRDGFVVQVDRTGGDWIPSHALDEHFGEVELGNFLRSKVKRYHVVDRCAALRWPERMNSH
jgi:hypothetical protein